MVIVRLKLDKILEDKKISRYMLSKNTGIRYHIIDNYYKNKVTRYDSFVLAKICESLNIKASDLFETIYE